tara:strand:+ start:761 stop:1111 length:351 start_codon:yes stop_codon:yes gene_type:complete
MADDFVPWSERADDDNVDDLIAMLSDAVQGQPETSGQDVVGKIIDDVFESRGEDVGIIGNFVLIGEIIDEEGQANLMVVTSDNLPEWIARGMIKLADEYISQGPQFPPSHYDSEME